MIYRLIKWRAYRREYRRQMVARAREQGAFAAKQAFKARHHVNY